VNLLPSCLNACQPVNGFFYSYFSLNVYIIKIYANFIAPGALLAFDAGALARQAGSFLAVNMVLLGALSATEYLPLAAAA
jgi:hypothetical protein